MQAQAKVIDGGFSAQQEVSKRRKKVRSDKPIIIENWKTRTFVIIFFCLLTFAMINVNYRVEKTLDYIVGAFATVSFIYLMLKMVLSFFYKPSTKDITNDYKVSVVIPCFNEDPESVNKVIKCLLEQDYPIYEIFFIDDGSRDKTAYEQVSLFAKGMKNSFKEIAATGKNTVNNVTNTKIITHRFKQNKGKKQAQAWGFKRAKGDIIMLVDSDGYLYPNAVRELLKPFEDKRVTSTVGHVNARNVKDNMLTRLQDIMYHSAFRIGRASQSITNCVLVCSGAISMHRRKIVVDHIDEFLKDKIFGINCEAGDDRCLTNISLKYGGRTKYQSTAMCITDVPITTKNFFKQQVRWAKSFYLYTFESMKYAWKKPFMMMWLLGEGFMWIFFTVSQVISLIHWTENYYITLIIFSIGYMVLSAFMNGIYYALKNPFLYLLAPFFALVHLFLLFPIRIWALVTLNNSSWGTR